MKAAQDKALEDARIAEELRLAQEKAEADLREAAEKKAAEDAAAAALLAAKKIVPNVTLYSISNSLKLSTYDSSYLKKYVSKLKPNAKVTCVGYVYTKNTTYAKAKLLASKQAKSVCALIKKQKRTIITSTLLVSHFIYYLDALKLAHGRRKGESCGQASYCRPCRTRSTR